MIFSSRDIGPTIDFGFKRLFGQEESKDILKQLQFDTPSERITRDRPERT